LSTGVLEHGDRLPSVRELSDELHADPRVILTAYQQLMEEGLVEIRSRSGVFAIGAFTPAGNALTVPRRWMLETLMGAIARDIPPLRLADHIRTALVSRRARAAVVECNEDQMLSMSGELRTYFGLNVIAIPLDAISPTTFPDELRDVDLLVSAGHTDVVARIASQIQKPYVIARARPSLIGRLARLLARGPVYFLVTDPRFGEKMRRIVAPMTHSENFHVLVVDRDDLRVIPPGAPTYVMRSAQPRLADKAHLGREIPPQRIFSDETSREILSHLLAFASDTGSERRAQMHGGS
jgi:hypothetical protein